MGAGIHMSQSARLLPTLADSGGTGRAGAGGSTSSGRRWECCSADCNMVGGRRCAAGSPRSESPRNASRYPTCVYCDSTRVWKRPP